MNLKDSLLELDIEWQQQHPIFKPTLIISILLKTVINLFIINNKLTCVIGILPKHILLQEIKNSFKDIDMIKMDI